MFPEFATIPFKPWQENLMDVRYAAGLFDGEGWVRINRWAKPNSIHIRYQVLAGLGMSHRPVVELMRATYGGSVHINRHDLRNPKHRPQFCWHIGSQLAVNFLRSVFPYLIVKADEAEIAIELQAHIDRHRKWGGRDRETILAYREGLYASISAAKHVRFPVTA